MSEAASDFKAAVVAESARAVALGAYADFAALHYLFLVNGGPYRLSYELDAERSAQAVSGEVPLFAWDEREMAQERGVRFADLPDSRPLRAKNGTMPEAVVAHGSGLMHFVVGPVHAGIIEPGRFTFSSGGETVVHLDAQLGYSHRGVERALEDMLAVDAAPLVARICGGCSASRSYAYALALEAIARSETPGDVDLARLVLGELERIYNHVADLAASASGAGWGAGFARGMALKEEAMRLCWVASGHRLLFDAIAPGGVVPHAVADRRLLTVEVSRLEERTARYLDAVFGNASLTSRWKGAGILSHETARVFGALGPAHRASRGKTDVRAFAPYGAYCQRPLRIAQAAGGDAFARCQVKRAELAESFRLILEALGELGNAPLSPVVALDIGSGSAIGVVEGPRGAETVALDVDAGRIKRLHVISASYRNWPLVAKAMDGNIVPDFPLVNKSFNLCYACVDR